MKTLFVNISLAGLLLLGGCAASQEDVITLDRRLMLLEQRSRELEKQNIALARQASEAGVQNERLRAQLDGFNQAMSSEDQKARAQYANVNVLVKDLEDELQGLRGKIEESQYLLRRHLGATEEEERKAAARLDRFARELELSRRRIEYLEQYLNVEQASAPEKTEAPSVAPAVSAGEEPTAKSLYIGAKQAFDRGEFGAARKGFEAVIEKFPQSEHADNAQFWIGEIYYREKWYEKAILEYQKVIEKYPDGNKVPASLLKQGFSFLNLGDAANARLILKELVKKHPDSNEGKIARQKLEELK